MSIDTYEKAIDVSLSITPVPASLIAWYGDLSEVYYISDNLEKAQLSCESALQKEQFVSNLDPLILVEIYDRLLFINYLKGNYEAALVWGRKVLEMRLTNLSPNDYMIGVSFNSIGETLFRMGVYDESLTNFQKAIDIYSKSIPTKNGESGNTYKNLKELFEITNQFNDAVESYKKSTEFLLKLYPLARYFYLFDIKMYPNNIHFHVLKRLIIMQNLTEMRLE
jgi:tetratricopeptide (TPR) repeat protein